MTHIGHSTTVTLPGGYVDDEGVRHGEVELAMMTGEDEYFLAGWDAHTASAAALVTELLARCVRRVGSVGAVTPTLLRSLLVGDRDYLLVKLRELTFGRQVACVLTCPQATCGEQMELSFDLGALAFESKPVASRYFALRLPDDAADAAQAVDVGVEFRLPTGADQEILSSLFWQNADAATAELLARCTRRGATHDDDTTGALPDAARVAVEHAIQRLAPDVEIELEAVCPACGGGVETAIDFAAHFFAELLRNLQSIEREVHFLAWHYHWSERDILAMTRARRRRYVALLQAEVDRLNQVW